MKLQWPLSQSNSHGLHAQRSRHYITGYYDEAIISPVSGKLEHSPNMTAFGWHIPGQNAEVLCKQAAV